jgi:Cu(I)/Ag(I) efflux system membrane fusion protein
MTRNTIIRSVTLAILLASTAGVLLAHSSTSQGNTAFEAALEPYEAIHAALANDTLEGVAANARKIQRIAGQAAADFQATTAGVPADKASQCQALLPKVQDAAARLARATTLEEARQAFGELSRPMVQWREMSTSTHKPNVVFCPMAKKPWLQESDQVANPYFGSKMLKCGNIVSR